MPSRGRGRGRRGATLLVTVLVATVAASIAVVMVQLALFALSTDVRAAAVDSAHVDLDRAREEVRSVLSHDPFAVFQEVLDQELPRVCLPREQRGDPDAVVSPGQTWPAECGMVWGYEPDPAALVAVKLTPPSPSAPDLVADIAARRGEVTLAARDTYVLGGLARPRVYSAGNLNASLLLPDSVEYPIYSFGALTPPTLPASAGALLASEEVFTPSAVAGVVNAGPVPASGPPEVVSVRAVYPRPMPASLLRSSVAALASTGCPPSSSSEPVGNFAPGRSLALCLEPGAWLTAASFDAVSGAWTPAADTVVEVPSSARGFLLLPGRAASGSSPATLRLFAALSSPGIPDSSAPVNSAHPGSLSFWSPLGEFLLPASGLVVSSADVYVGLCGSAFSTGAPCASYGTTTPGSVFPSALTVVAGSPGAPADIIVGGPLLPPASGSLGLVASGDVVVPYFAQRASAGLTVTADVVALGAGSDEAPVRSAPNSAISSPRALLQFRGLWLAEEISWAAPVFSAATWDVPVSVDDVAPWLPAPGLQFERAASERLPAAAAQAVFDGRPGL